MHKANFTIKLFIFIVLATCLGTTIAPCSQIYNITVATDTPGSPQIGTPGAGGSGYDLRGAILAANLSNSTDFTFNFVFPGLRTINLVNHLPMVSNFDGTSATAAPINKTWTFNGNNTVIIDGGNSYRALFFSPAPATTTESDLPAGGYTQQLNVTIKDLTIQNVLAKGGDGGLAGGGGMGRRCCRVFEFLCQPYL